jgi:large subunit ribosomal protein L25
MTLVLEAKSRTVFGKKVRSIRKKGILPAVKYGNHKDPVHLELDTKTFEKVFAQAGESTLVDLQIDGGKPIKVLLHQFDRNPVTNALQHADFLEVNMSEKITAEVELNFIGESKAVKELGGILVKNHTTVEVECLPQDLVHQIDVDISALKAFDDRISISGLVLPKGIALKEKSDDVIVLVTEPRSEKELEELDQKIEEKVEDVEVEKKGKVEEEGEAAAEAEPAPKAPKAKEQKKKE